MRVGRKVGLIEMWQYINMRKARRDRTEVIFAKKRMR
jgi:hypothetical protein